MKICFLCLTFSLVLTSQAQDSPFDILKKIQDNKTEEAIRNEQRESRFRTEAEKQNSLMRKAEAEVAAQESTRRKLQVDFDKNEELLTDLETKLDKRVGDLGELFGVFRQVADDTETMIFDSLITLEKPERKASISRLAESTEIPTIPQMRELWSLLIEEAVQGPLFGCRQSFEISARGQCALREIGHDNPPEICRETTGGWPMGPGRPGHRIA